VAVLLQHDVNPMLKDKSGKNALDYAHETGQTQVLAALEQRRKQYLEALGESIDNEVQAGTQVKVSKPLGFKKGPAA
jgi:hypothetical protein